MPPSTIRPNHKMNLWMVTKRLNAMGANVHKEELHFIKGLEYIME